MNAPPKGAGWSLACAWGVFGFCRVLCPVCVCETESETRRAYVWRCGRAYSGLHALLLLVTRSHCDRTLPAGTFSLSLFTRHNLHDATPSLLRSGVFAAHS